MGKKIKACFVCLFAAALSLVLCVCAFGMTNEGRYVILLDPGHGGTQTGTCEATHPEYYYNMKVALACKDALEADGRFSVYLSHEDNDTTVEMVDRGILANTVNADMIFSIHFDGSENTRDFGCEGFVSVLDEYDLSNFAQSVLENINQAVGMRIDRVYRKADTGNSEGIYYWDENYHWDFPSKTAAGRVSDYYSMLTWGAKFGIQPIIVEHGYMSNETDRAIAEDDANLEKIGQADAKSIIEYFTNHTHDFAAATLDFPSSCLFAGKTSEKCTICRARKNVTAMSSLPDENSHYWILTESRDVSCTTDGYKKYVCRYAQNLIEKKQSGTTAHEKTVVTEATGHEYKIIKQVEAKHGQDGITTYQCAKCGYTYTDLINSTPHTFVLTAEVLPECDTSGYRLFRCSECGFEYNEHLAAPGHSFDIVEEVAPSCAADGMRTKVCSICHAATAERIPMTEHKFIETTRTQPSCDIDGVITYSCTVCGETKTENIDMLGHDMELVESDGGLAFVKVYTEICRRDKTHTGGSYTEIFGIRAEIIFIAAAFLVLLTAFLIISRLLMTNKRRRRKKGQQE